MAPPSGTLRHALVAGILLLGLALPSISASFLSAAAKAETAETSMTSESALPDASASVLHSRKLKQHRRLEPKCGTKPTKDLAYGGGKVLSGGPKGLNLYVIYYGNWDASGSDCTQPTLANLIYSLMIDSPLVNWWKVVTKYCDSTGSTPNNMTNIMGPAVYDTGSAGKQLESTGSGSNSFWQVILNNVAKGYLSLGDNQPDPNGLFLILTGSDIKVQGSNAACGFHSFGTWGSAGRKVPFAVVPQPTAQSSCKSASHNKCPKVDSISANILQQLAESVTDPFGDGWRIGSDKKEIGDLCADKPAFQAEAFSESKFEAEPVYDVTSKTCFKPSPSK